MQRMLKHRCPENLRKVVWAAEMARAAHSKTLHILPPSDMFLHFIWVEEFSKLLLGGIDDFILVIEQTAFCSYNRRLLIWYWRIKPHIYFLFSAISMTTTDILLNTYYVLDFNIAFAMEYKLRA